MWHFLRELPITILRAISDLLEWMLVSVWSPFVRSEDEPRRSFGQTLLMLPVLLPYWVFRLGLAVVSFPFAALFMPPVRRNCFLRGLPALLGVMVCLIGFGLHRYFHERILMRYISRVQGGFMKNEFSKSYDYGKRMVVDSWNDREERIFLYALVVGQVEGAAASSAILESLAPDDAEGLTEAHRARAFEFAELVRRGSLEPDMAGVPESLEGLRWHLEHSGDADSDQMQNLWFVYNRAAGDLDGAEASLQAASKFNPMFFLPLSEFLRERGKDAAADKALVEASKAFVVRLNENPLSKPTRLQLVVALNKLKRTDDAERVLIAGLQLHRDMEMQTALSDFYLLLMEELRKGGEPLSRQLTRLIQAIRADNNSIRVLNRCVEFLDSKGDADSRNEIREALETMMVDGSNVGMAHFLLGCLEVLGMSTADGWWHLRQSVSIDKSFGLLCNNMSVALGLQPSPDWELATQFGELAVLADSSNAVYFETLGHARLEAGGIDEAIQALQRAVELRPDRKLSHRYLAEAFVKAGRTAEAAEHRGLGQ
jgi:tetratricopeptide (TPR) repeat protein